MKKIKLCDILRNQVVNCSHQSKWEVSSTEDATTKSSIIRKIAIKKALTLLFIRKMEGKVQLYFRIRLGNVWKIIAFNQNKKQNARRDIVNFLVSTCVVYTRYSCSKSYFMFGFFGWLGFWRFSYWFCHLIYIYYIVWYSYKCLKFLIMYLGHDRKITK